MAFAQSHPLNAFKTFTATPSSGITANSSNNKPIKEIVLMPDDEPVYGPPSTLSAYSEYELGLSARASIPTSTSTPGQMNTCGNNMISPQNHEIAPPPYHQYIAQQQQQRQMLQHQQQYPVVTARSITSPSDQVMSNSYAEVVFHQRPVIRKTSDFSSPSTGARGMRPPPSPQPKPPIPSHSPNSKMRTYSDPVHNGILPSQPPPPPPHGRPLSGTLGPNKTPPTTATSFSSSVQTYTATVPLEMSASSNFSSSAQYYQHQMSQSSSHSSSSHHAFSQFPHSVPSANPSMSFPISRSRVRSQSNDNLDVQTHNSTNHIPEPPRLPPQSGVLHRTTGKVVLKPHAFKPVTPRSQSGSASCHSSPLRLNESRSPSASPPQQNCTPEGMRPRSQTGRSHDGSSSLSSGTAPVISVPALETSHSLDEMIPASCPPPAFANSNGPVTKSIPVIPSPSLEPAAASVAICNGDETPLSSMCRSVSDHEMVKQRETELMTLRRTMEQNEEAMLRVFEERRNELEKQLNLEQQCVAKLETALQATTVQLRHTEMRLSDAESQLHTRQMKATPPPLPPHSSGSRPSSMAGASRRDTAIQTTGDLMEQLETLQRQLNAREAIFEVERSQWLEEKSKVISYQKQMQLNYVQLCSKTQRLENEVQQLTLDLERKDLHLSNLTNGINRS